MLCFFIIHSFIIYLRDRNLDVIVSVFLLLPLDLRGKVTAAADHQLLMKLSSADAQKSIKTDVLAAKPWSNLGHATGQ